MLSVGVSVSINIYHNFSQREKYHAEGISLAVRRISLPQSGNITQKTYPSARIGFYVLKVSIFGGY